jgi:hypothetical protein
VITAEERRFTCLSFKVIEVFSAEESELKGPK